MGVDDVSPAPVSPSAETRSGETQPAQSHSPQLASAQHREPLESAVHLAVGAAWWMTGPVRWGGRLAARAAEEAVADARRRSRWLHTRTQGRAGTAPGGKNSSIELLIQALLRPLVTRVVNAALAEMDLTGIILDNVDLDAVAAKLDVEAVIRRVDLDGVVAGVDLDAAVRRVDLDQIVARIDVDSIVAGVDLDAVVDRIDVDGIV
ncbi:MAG TPA: hypothetical protein VII33_08540, partial [Nakamurella sp.]